MKTMLKAAFLVGLVGAGFALVCGSSASADERRPLVPLFSCGVSFGAGGQPMVTVTKTAGGPAVATKDVVAAVTTPNGKVDALLCGKQFPANGSHASVSFSTQVKKGYLYLCTASQGTTTFACNPPQ